MREDIIVVNPAGLDRGGSETLGRQFAELLDCPVVFRLRPKEDYEESGRTHYFRENEDLDRYNPKLAIINLFDIRNGWFASKSPEDFMQYFKDRGIITVFVFCIRSNMAKAIIKGNEHLIKNSDYVLYYSDSLQEEMESLNKNAIKTDINIFNFNESMIPLKFEDRLRIVTTAGRVEAIKALPRFFRNLKSNINDNIYKDVYFIHQGARFKESLETKKISGPLGLIQLLCDGDLKTKEINKSFNCIEKEFELSDRLEHNKINMLLPYDKENIKDIWPRLLVNIYPVLGKIKADNGSKKEKNYIDRHKGYWDKSMEYAQLEMIDYGTPVLFSKEFLENYEYGQELLDLDFYYECYEDIPDALSKTINDKDKYEYIANSQKEIMMKAQEDINNKFKTLIEDLTK